MHQTWLQIYKVLCHKILFKMAVQVRIFMNIPLMQSAFNANIRRCSQMKNIPVLTLFTKENCQLCDEALEELKPYRHLVQLKEVDIEKEGNEVEYNKYRYEIPVFFLNNKFLCKNRMELDKLRVALKV